MTENAEPLDGLSSAGLYRNLSFVLPRCVESGSAPVVSPLVTTTSSSSFRVVRRIVEKLDLYDLDDAAIQTRPIITTTDVTKIPVPYAA